MKEDKATPAEQEPQHGLDAFEAATGPAGWVKISFWARPVDGKPLSAAIQALVDALKAQDK